MTIVCVCGCGRTGPHKARGLIKPCYKRATRHGHLDRYPLQTVHIEDTIGARVRADRLARIEDYIDLREWGVSRRDAEERLGVTRRTIGRWHAWLRAQGATYSWLPPMPAHLVAA